MEDKQERGMIPKRKEICRIGERKGDPGKETRY